MQVVVKYQMMFRFHPGGVMHMTANVPAARHTAHRTYLSAPDVVVLALFVAAVVAAVARPLDSRTGLAMTVALLLMAATLTIIVEMARGSRQRK